MNAIRDPLADHLLTPRHQAMARTTLRAGRPVVIANSRSREALTSVIAALGDGASAGTVADAAASPIVVIAVPWASVPEALEGLRWNGQIVIDVTNDFDPRDLDGRTSSEVVADLVGGSPVVKAANTLAAAVLAADPREAGGQRVLLLSGDDRDAKAEVGALFQDAGFFTIDLGDLITGGEMQQIGAPLAGANLIRLPDPNQAMAVGPELTPSEAADRLAIRELFDGYDRRDVEGQKALFTVDTRFAVYMDGQGSERTYVLEGRDALTPVFADLNRYEATTHFNGQSMVEIDGNRATGESYTIAHHVYTEDGRRKIMIASLRYLDTFVRIDRAWFIAERNLIVDWSETRCM